MVVLTIAVLALVGIAGAWATLNRDVRPVATPAAAERVAGSDAPGRRGLSDVGDHLGSAADQAALEQLVPSSVAALCEPRKVIDPQLAAVTCTTSDGYTVVYETYPTRVALDKGWRLMVYEQDLTMDGGECESGQEGEAGWYYTDGNPDDDEGRDACFMDGARPVIVWTDYATRTRVWLDGPAGTTIEATFERWDEGNLDPVR